MSGPSHDKTRTDILEQWLASVRGVSPVVLSRVRAAVRQTWLTDPHADPQSDPPTREQVHYDVEAGIERVLSDEWDTFSAEEGLHLRWPRCPAVGDRPDIPNRGTGTIVRQQLTRRFGVEVVFQMQDGSMLQWEFID